MTPFCALNIYRISCSVSREFLAEKCNSYAAIIKKSIKLINFFLRTPIIGCILSLMSYMDILRIWKQTCNKVFAKNISDIKSIFGYYL